MPEIIKFKEPERCDYLYVDEHNKVHIILPIVGGDEIGLDNTCETSRELTSFFYGSRHDGIVRSSAEAQLTEYKKQLEEDIKAIHTQKKISPHAFSDLLKAKVDRLKQIEQYIQLIKIAKDNYDVDDDLSQLHTSGIPRMPSAVKEIIGSSENAFAVRLSHYDNDKFTRFDDPVFSLMRNISKHEYNRNNTGAVIPITEGLVKNRC